MEVKGRQNKYKNCLEKDGKKDCKEFREWYTIKKSGFTVKHPAGELPGVSRGV